MQKIAAVIVTYNPTKNFIQNVFRIREQVDTILVFDNGSEKESVEVIESILSLPGVHTILSENNLGVATALNQGFSWAIEQGFEYALTFDQDSYPYPEMVKKLINIYKTHPEPSKIAIAAPNVIDKVANIRSRYLYPTSRFTFELSSCANGHLKEVSFVITSGSLCSLSAYTKIGSFRDDYFIDYVDLEYCFRARSLGYKIIVACEATLAHSLGKREERNFLGSKIYPRFHSPSRWYYQSRNRILFLKEYVGKNPYLFFYESLNIVCGISRMLFFENQRLEKIEAIIRGIADAIKQDTKFSP